MAFVSESQRVYHNQKMVNPLGPGQYQYPDTKNQKQSYAPFLSTSKRKSNITERKVILPGPGDYEVMTKIVDPIIQTLSNNHSIIVKINSTGTVPFKSAKQRFDDKYAEVPGPGSYITDVRKNNDDRDKKKRSVTSSSTKDHNVITNIRQINKRRKNATIPNRIMSLSTNKQKQKEKEKEQLKNQQNSKQEVGPGKYQVLKQFGKNGKGSLWGKDQIKRFEQKKKIQDQFSNVGPGKYNANENRKLPQYKYNPSFSFISDTVRTHFDNIYYKTNQNFKAKIRMKSNFKSSEPGPGQYESNITAISLKSTPYPFQFFGSTVQRFSNQNQNPVGPGIYKLQSDFQNKKFFNKAPLSFNSTGEREPQFLDIHTSFVPGPGSYTEVLNNQINKGRSKARKAQMFGVTQKRFEQNKQIIQKPGPGAYFEYPDEQPAYNSNRQLNNYSFRSSTNRDCFGQIKDSVPIGAYDVKNFDLASKLQKQKTFIENLKKIDVEKAAFDSSNSRFPHYQNRKNVEKAQEEQVLKQKLEQFERESKSVSRQPEKNITQPGFLVAERRFSDQKKGAPSVGSYELESPWEKKSYNVKYQHHGK